MVTDYLEGALDRRKRRRFEAHVAECDGCEAYLDQIRATVALTGSLRPSRSGPRRARRSSGLFRGWGGRPSRR